MKFDTIAVQYAHNAGNNRHCIPVPIYQTTAFDFDNVQYAADLFDLKTHGDIYTRISNPTTQVLEERIAALEGGVGALAVSSGQSASAIAVLNIAKAGDEVVASSTLYGGTFNLLNTTLRKLGINTRFVRGESAQDYEQLITDSDVEKIPDKLICFCGKLRKVTLSEKVTSVGKSAFEGCINLSVVENTENLREISDRAFFGTSIRVLDIPGSVRKLGKEILGCGPKASEQCEIEKYLIKLDASLAAKSKGFNNVGAHKCGYIVRKKGKLRLCYPMKSVKGSYKPVSEREKMIFKALAYTSIDKEDIELVKSESKLQKITDKLKSLFRPKE